MNNKYLSVYSLIITLLFSGLLFTANSSSDFADSLRTNVHSFSIFEKSFVFADETIPTDNFDVAERLDREVITNTFYHTNTMLCLKRAPRYLPDIERILAEMNMPDDLKYVAVAESALSNASSPAGAKGIWQIMEGTARDYGLEVNSEVDERYDLEKSTRLACDFFKKGKDRFGTWSAAAAAYNMGAARLDREFSDQRAKNFYELNTNSETSRYFFRVVAAKEIMEHPETYGYYVAPQHKYSPLDNFVITTVDTTIPNLGDFAVANGTNYRMLKVFNPWLMSNSLTVRNGKIYQIKIPK
ncbi:MAG: lytic transglycosylase domain-containing protein [Saprospiraceae bacterium]|nr:lytic transglycosylase domain-containing protein [Saprospiraceae bacterium]MBP7699741.1 lytic transglycosylase domain-containing protein [Saprospiraceae bacterium]